VGSRMVPQTAAALPGGWLRKKYRSAALVFMAVSATASASPPRPLPPQIEGVMEIRSYGERPRDLLALLVPFIGGRHFAPDLRRRVTDRPEGTELFRGPDATLSVRPVA
jgi:hypothetical protein